MSRKTECRGAQEPYRRARVVARNARFPGLAGRGFWQGATIAALVPRAPGVYGRGVMGPCRLPPAPREEMNVQQKDLLPGSQPVSARRQRWRAVDPWTRRHADRAAFHSTVAGSRRPYRLLHSAGRVTAARPKSFAVRLGPSGTRASRKAAKSCAEYCDVVVAGGLSMGGILALLLAQRRPRACRGLLLYAPTLKLDGWSMPWYSRVLPYVRPTALTPGLICPSTSLMASKTSACVRSWYRPCRAATQDKPGVFSTPAAFVRHTPIGLLRP